MAKVLIVSDSLKMAYSMENAFSMAGWSCNSISLSSMLRLHSVSAGDYQCVALVVDAGFRKRLGNNMEEMRAVVEACARNMAVYLVFESDYDPVFAAWLEHAKRLFKLASQPDNLRNAVAEMVRQEPSVPSRTAFVSPMDSI